MMLDSKPISQLYLILSLVFTFLPVGAPLSCGRDENLVEYAGILHEDLGDSKGSVGCKEFIRACTHSDSLCFLSTILEGAGCEEEVPLKALGAASGGVDAELEILPSGARVHKLFNGKKIVCSLIGGKGEEDDVGLFSRKERPMPPAAWMQESSGISDASSVELKSNLDGFPLAQDVDIYPPLLDWGRKHMYSVSFASLTVTNMHNGSRLNVYEPTSTDAQFYPHDFEELSLGPGEVATIKFVFLPRRVGPLSAHVMLEISLGGQSSSDVFIINAKGVAGESPFRIQPLVGFEFLGNGLFTRGLSLYNPFDQAIAIEEVILQLSLVSANRSDYLQASCERIQQFHGERALTNFSHLQGNEYDGLLVEMRPRGKWEINSLESETILNIALEAYKERSVRGIVCINMKKSSSVGDEIETIIFPLEVRKHQGSGYHNPSGAFSVFLDPYASSENEKTILIMSLRNDASRLLSVSEILENSARKKLFGIKYAKGLILYPGSLTRVASVTCSLQDDFADNLKGNTDCKLRVLTNGSISYVDIPCQDLQHACTRKIPQSQLDQSSESSSSFSEILEANEFIFRNWKSQGFMGGATLLEKTELIFSEIEVGDNCSKWIRVKNPSQQPIVVQIFLNSEAMVHLCKPADNLLYPVSGHVAHAKQVGILDGFFLPKSAITEAFLHPSESADLGPIVFRPSDRCMWRSSALIKNNLSGVEWSRIHGTGASSLVLLLEDSRAIHKLDFYPNWSIPLNIISAETQFLDGNASFSCGKLLSKELQVKNVGDLTLEVLKLQVSGSSCELDGFTLHTCKGFALSPGESASLHISYRPDFSVSVINRDLELVLPFGTITVPMKATIPVSMMRLCMKSYFWSFWTVLLLLLLIGVSFIGLLNLMPYLVIKRSTDHVVKDETISAVDKVGKEARIHHNPKNIRIFNAPLNVTSFRMPKEGLKPEVVIIRRYSDAQDGAQGVPDIVASKKDMDCGERNLPNPTPSELKSRGENGMDISDILRSSLTVKTGKEKGRRRKRRISGLASGLTSKPPPDVCSSQSGNSTPPSPLSPSPFTPKQVRPSSPDTSDCSFVRESVERNHETHKSGGRGSSSQGDNHHELADGHEKLQPQRPTSKHFLTPSATFPRSSWHAPVVATPVFSSSTSPVAAYARAPGSNLGRDKIKRSEEPALSKEFTYDIWGDHISDHIMGRSKEHLPKPFVKTSEGDSPSFFARGPQSLVKMSSSVRSISPGPKLPSYDVSHNHNPIV